VEVDVHWVARGGDDPVAYLRKVSERCPLVHFKDLDPAWAAIRDHADPRPFTAGTTSEARGRGAGMIDFPAVAKAAEHAQWWIVEQDFCAGPGARQPARRRPGARQPPRRRGERGGGEGRRAGGEGRWESARRSLENLRAMGLA
jgi:sugar phosphate isomerase/epimerase